ncbi:MAG: AAA family ATPase [Chitinivibrionales bacterium]
MKISIPTPSLVVLIGVAGSGKSAFAHRWFTPTSIVSSDFCRALISDNEEDQSVSPDAFRLLYFIVRKRLKHKRLVVVDATNLNTGHRRRLLTFRDNHQPHMPALAFVFNLPLPQSLQQNAGRTERQVEKDVIVRQQKKLERTIPVIFQQNFHQVVVFESQKQVNRTSLSLIETPLL